MKIKSMSAIVYALILAIGLTGCQKEISTLDSNMSITSTNDSVEEASHDDFSDEHLSVCDTCVLDKSKNDEYEAIEESNQSNSENQLDDKVESSNKVDNVEKVEANSTSISNNNSSNNDKNTNASTTNQNTNSQSSSAQTANIQTSNTQTAPNQVTNSEIDYRSKIRVDGDVSADRLSLLNTELNKIPKNLINKFFSVGGTIVLTSYDIGSHYFPEKGFGKLMELHDGGNQVLYINSREDAIQKGTPHGFGHVLDSLTGWSFNSETFLSIFEKEKNTFKTYDGRDYFKNNEREFFAELFHNYLKSPSTAKNSAPEGYAYVVNKLNSL
jgi:hypothetical protein